MLGEKDKTELLQLARTTLESYLSSGITPQYEPESPILKTSCGAFVSLHRGEELRGCIGQIIGDRELCRIVQNCAISAATEDTRFRAVTASELPDIEIEISVLTPFHEAHDPEEVEVGRHGLYIVKGGYRGLLLPQVATHYNWDRETFLDQTCRKAGLREGAWKDPSATVYLFEAEVFSESSYPRS